MNSPQSLPTPWARLISIHPEKRDIPIFQETIEDQPNAQWRISRSPISGEIFIKNMSALYLQVDGNLLPQNQEKQLLGGERLCFNKQNKNFDYVFCVLNSQPESLEKLAKIETDLQKELTCSICTEFLSKCMILTPCLHTFCSYCLFDCIKSSNQCPLCRVEAVSVAKNSVLSNMVQIVADHFPAILQKSQDKKELEQIDSIGTIVRNEEGVYIGSIINGKKEGQGKIISKDGSIYEGSWKNNKAEGKGTMIFKSGNRYDGFWLNDRRHGIGKFMWTDGQEFEGTYQNDERSGYGIMRYMNGMVYKGDWKNGKKEGQGVATYPWGYFYDGSWMNNCYNGMGKYIWKNGEEYEGNFQDNKRAGYGKMKEKDGRIYQGEWKNDKKEGDGILTLPNKDKYEGKWINDILQPKIKIEYHSGEKYEGEIETERGMKQGKGILTFKNGERYEGFWENDKQHGKGRQVSQDGKIQYEGVWKEGTISGEGIMTDTHGNKYKAEWKPLEEGESSQWPLKEFTKVKEI